MIRSAGDILSEKLNKLRVVGNISSIERRDFSIIASNCAGTLPYRFLNMPYTSPTINLFFFAPCYIKFVNNLEYYLSLPLRFKVKSSYKRGEFIRTSNGNYPLGKLDDIEIHFMHYANEVVANQKWHRRKQRINFDNLILAFTDKDHCTPELLKEFDNLPYANKFVLTAKYWPEIQSHIRVPHFEGMAEIGDCYTRYDYLTHVNFRELIKCDAKLQNKKAGKCFSANTPAPFKNQRGATFGPFTVPR